MDIRGEGYRADCAKCVGSKFTCDEHYAIERAYRDQDRDKSGCQYCDGYCHERNQVEQHPTEPCRRNPWVQVEMAKAMADVCEGDPAEWAANLEHELARDDGWAGRLGA